MPLGSHEQVIAGTVLLAERAQRKAEKQIRRDLDPLIEAIKKGKSADGVLRRLSPALVDRMGTKGIEEGVADAGTQAALIGIVAATPRKAKGARRRAPR